jgi:hypothetical protein
LTNIKEMSNKFSPKILPYFCYICDINCHKKNVYEKHLLTLKHIKKENGNGMSMVNSPYYYCELCHIKTNNKKDYELHLFTAKHKKKEKENKFPQDEKPQNIYKCDRCTKQYTCHSGLWKHQKKCIHLPSPIPENNLTNDNDNANDTIPKINTLSQEQIMKMFMEEIHKMISEQNKTFLEVIKISGNHSHNTITTNNSHNKTFNLQFFLNETCKNAMNITDFVDQIVLNLNDLEETGRIGFADGISKMILTRLKALDVTERPIHCSDLKRETLFIKVKNVWEKEEDEKPILTNAVKDIALKNIMQIQTWQKKILIIKTPNQGLVINT